LANKRDDLRLNKKKHDQRLIKERGPDARKRDGRLSMKMIEKKGSSSNDQNLKNDQA
jgi:hypothetical protein